jgi:heme/copper-type cytochrome/quinol oxidase subunit 3
MRRSGVSNGVLGMAFFVASEAMFFVALISAFLVLRAGAGVWPPMDQPRLPVLLTAFNTALLLASAGGMRQALLCSERDRLASALTWTAALGAGFLLMQGYEWARLLYFGLTTASSLYGATFYILVGAHALHVVAALVALWSVRGRLLASSDVEPERLWPMALYWYFVVAVWPVLYVLIYLL